MISFSFFFFQAEDGIRDWSVTGVQTCALPISHRFAAGLRPAQGETAGACSSDRRGGCGGGSARGGNAPVAARCRLCPDWPVPARRASLAHARRSRGCSRLSPQTVFFAYGGRLEGDRKST